MFRAPGRKADTNKQPVPRYIKKLLAKLFANISQADRPAWESNIERATKVATIIVASANRLGCHDVERIKNVVCGFILSDFERDQLDSKKIYFSMTTFRMADQNILNFRRTIQRILARMQAVKVDKLLANFFNEPLVGMRESMFIFWYNLPPLPTASLPYLRDWVVMERFLNANSKVMLYIDQLESALQAHVATRPDAAVFSKDCYGRYRLPSHPSKRYKLLSEFFYQWAESKGFKQSVKILTALTTDNFLKLLVDLSLIKDSGIGEDEHGIWSHAIQFYVFVEYAEDSKVFQHAALDILRSLGGGTLKAAESFPSAPWNYIMDVKGGSDFSCPEYINALLWYRFIPRWPLLSESVWRAEQAPKRHADVGYRAHLMEKHSDEVDGGVVIRKFKV